MTPLEFLTAVWPTADDSSFYCIALTSPIKGMKHSIFRTIPDAAAFVERVKTTDDVFFCVHTLKQEKVWNLKRFRNKETKEWIPGWSTRTQQNMRESLSLFFDLDVEPGNSDKYQSQTEAIQAIKGFVTTYDLPRPMVVNSGGGVHIYFLLLGALASSSEWATQATRLKQLAVHFGLKIDPTRTTDTASVLRVAGTFNLKHETPRPVAALCAAEQVAPENWSKRLEKALDGVDIVPARQKMDVAPDGLGSNVGSKTLAYGNPPPASAIYEVCPQLARLRDTTTKGHNAWWAGMGVLQHSREGREACHEFTKIYPGYSHAEVESKCDDWKGGPTTCAKLSSSCGQKFIPICQSCPHVTKNSGPWSIAKLATKAPRPVVEDLVDGVHVTREIPNPPPPYKRSEAGQVEKLVENGKTGLTYMELVHEYDLYPIDRMSDDRGETETQVWRAHLPHGLVRDFSISASDFVDSRALASRLANNGVYSGKPDELRTYMNSYIRELQRRHVVNKEYPHLGWTDKDRNNFVLPHGIVGADGSMSPVNLGREAKTVIQKFAGKAGTLQRQVELLRFYEDPKYVGQQFIVVAALASPMFYATGHYGVIVSAYGETSSSKSTAVYAGASMYGDPVPYVINGTKQGGTVNFGPQVMQALSNLPYMVDEVSRMEAEEAKDAAYGNTQQGGRGSLKSDRTIRRTLSDLKSSITIFSTNTSLQSLVAQRNNAGQAAAVRVFEITLMQAKMLGVHQNFEADEFLRELKKNYGHIGEHFLRRIMPFREALENRIQAMQKELEIAGNMTSEERFWFAVAADVLVTLKVAVKLGLLTYDYDYMRDWLLTVQLPGLRSMVREEALAVAPLTILTNYLEEKNNHILRNNSLTKDLFHVPHGALLGHYDLSTPRLVLLKSGFKENCERKNLPAQAILRELMNMNAVTDMDQRFTLGIGTPHAKGRAQCFTVRMDHADIVKAAVPQMLKPNIMPMGSAGPAKSNVVTLRPGSDKQ